MRRRDFLRGAAATGGLAALAGCSAIPFVGGSSAPPRESNVISDIEMGSGAMQIDLADEPFVESRKDASAEEVGSLAAPNLAALLPVGRASAAKGGGGGGKGATGRGSGGYRSAPTTSKGRAKYHGGAYANDWRDDHENEIETYRASIAAVGIAYLGSNTEFQDDKPGSGPVPWDEQITDPENTLSYPVDREGWYRVGTELEAPGGGTSFGWEAVDLQVGEGSSGMEVEEEWKVSPRL
jgi:hypothetical protein